MPCRPMTPHEKECALAAVATLIERAEKEKRARKELKELRAWYREILREPIEQEER
jgi:hypothetical protein